MNSKTSLINHTFKKELKDSLLEKGSGSFPMNLWEDFFIVEVFSICMAKFHIADRIRFNFPNEDI